MRGNFVSDTVRQRFHVPLDNPVLAYTTVFTTKTNIVDHEPLREPGVPANSKGISGRVYPGLEPQTGTYRLSDDLVKRFITKHWLVKLSPGKKGKKHLPKKLYIEVLCQIAIGHDNKNIKIGLEICAPECVPHRRKLLSTRSLNQQS